MMSANTYEVVLVRRSSSHLHACRAAVRKIVRSESVFQFQKPAATSLKLRLFRSTAEGARYDTDRHRGRLFLLQEQCRFLAQYWKKVLGCLREEPRQRYFDAQRVLQHFDGPQRGLTQRAHTKAHCVFFPGLLLD